METNNIDAELLGKFNDEIWNKVPHVDDGKIVNATPLTDLTEDWKECARDIYKLNIDDKDLKIYGKFDSTLLSG